LAGRIQQIVATGLKNTVKDPRLEWVTVTDVRVTGDLHDATVFYTVFGDEADREAATAALEDARGQLRSEVGRQTGVKFTPTLAFVLDAVPDTARHIDELLAVAAQADAQVQAARAEAEPAGEADPYKKPREAETAEWDGDLDNSVGADAEDDDTVSVVKGEVASDVDRD
jgi:ribosome-binding factor A